MNVDPFKTIKKNEGPSLGVHFHISENKINEIKLCLTNHPGIEWHFFGTEINDQLIVQINVWMESYLKGIKAPLPSLSDKRTPPFHAKVRDYMKDIPYGELRTYGGVAEEVGCPGAARAVGTACKGNYFPLLIPCHRVVSSQYKICGYAFGLEVKKRLLMFEESWHRIRT